MTSYRLPPALITGADEQTGYATARALAKLNVPLIGLCSNRASRFCRSHLWDQLVSADRGGQRTLEKLIALGRSSAKTALFPTQDDVVQLVSDNREELEKYYAFVYPRKSIVDRLIDKTAFHEYATQQGFPVPESYIARSKIELQTILAGIKFPVVIKPHFRTEQWLKKSKLHKVFKLHDVTELESIGFDLFEAAPRFLIQRWIPGGDDKVYFCLMYIDRRGQERGYYAGKKLLQWPRLTGNTAIAVGTTDEAIHKLAADVLLRTKARGLCSLEVKKSDEDGNYYITEPTIGRNNYQSYIAVAGGVNLTELAFHDAINEEKQIAAVHRKMAMWIDEDFSWRAIKSSIGREELHFVPIVRGLANRLTFSHLNLTDWMPFFLLVHGLLPKRLRKLLRYFRIFILHPIKTLRRK